ncbi:MAG TPA: phosphotransferase [Mycobacteriales bacterium]|nr:phosphotransferase [Mycobacteriales bacterium]
MAPRISDLQRMLCSVFSPDVVITDTERLAPWCVLRCRLDGTDGPESVIVKWLREDPNGFRIDPEQMRTEQAALEFLADLDFARSPRFVVGDQAAHLILIEDLAPRTPLAALLREAGAAGDEMRSFARALGELAVTTVGRSDEFYRRRRALGPVHAERDRQLFRADQWADTRGILEALDVRISAAVDRELDSALAELDDPGPFLAMSNGDPEANNFLIGEGGGKIIDFEFARYHHALVDAVWMHVPGPMWMTVADPVVPSVESEYRTVLAEAIPQAADDRLFGFGLSAACGAFAISRLNRFGVVDRRAEGDLSRPQMVSILEAAARTAEDHGALPQLRGWLREVAEFLRRRWKDADVDLAKYRSYTPRHP